MIPHMITSFWKKIDIQFCDILIGIHINLENAATIITWRTVNNAAVIYVTSSPPLDSIITKIRSNFSYGFVDWVEFRYSSMRSAP